MFFISPCPLILDACCVIRRNRYLLPLREVKVPIAESKEYARLFKDAEEIASDVGQSISSAHVLVAFYAAPCKAALVLEKQGITQEVLIDAIEALPKEPKRLLALLKEKSRELAESFGAREIDTLHVLNAMTRISEASSYHILEQAECNISSLRLIVMGYCNRGLPATMAEVLKAQELAARATARRSTTATARAAKSTIMAKNSPLDELPINEYARPTQEAAPSGKKAEKPRFEVAKYIPADEETDFLKEKSVPAKAPLLAPKSDAPNKAVSSDGSDKEGAKSASKAPRPLSPEVDYPVLAEVSTNLLERAAAGDLDEAICRDEEIQQLLDILGRRRANNPCLIGPPGVGKTAIVEGLALKIERGDDDVANMQDKVLLALSTGALVAGTSLRGAFSERLCKIKEEVAAAKGRIIVFIDEIHTLIGAGASGESAQDAAGELKTALARGTFPCIGATTAEEYKKYIEQDAALARRFTPVYVEEPSPDVARLILEAAICNYNEHHHVTFTPEAIKAACYLSARFMPDLNLPAKAFDLIDLAGSRTRRMHKKLVTQEDIAALVHEQTKVPMDRLLENNQERLNKAENTIRRSFIGHPDVVRTVCDAVRRGYAGFSGTRPIASLLFLGPTGVGKTELTKALANLLFGKRDAILRIDMSEFSESHSVARLIGAPPGYVGHDEGGQLTDPLRRHPFQIILFDEIEKSHRDVQALLLQLLDEGHLTDSKGRKVSFANTLIIMTSNLGFENGLPTASGTSTIGFNKNSAQAATKIKASDVLERARTKMAPELWGRIDEKLVFMPLTKQQVSKIAQLQLNESADRLLKEREIQLVWEEPVVEFLLNHGGFTQETGARGMRQTIQRYVEAKVAKEVLSGKLSSGDMVSISPEGEELILTTVE